MTRARSRSPGPTVAVALVGSLAAALLVTAVLVLAGGPRPAPSPSPRALEPSPVTAALQTLRDWDRSRSRAWSAGSPRRLGELYLPGSAAGAADVRLLRRYGHRGVRVVGMRTQVLSLVVVARDPGRWRLRVTDRLARSVAVRADGHPTGSSRGGVVLPRDAASTRLIELRRGGDGRWRVSSVTDRLS